MFGSYSGTNRDLWVGLHRKWQGGPLVWVTGEKVDYSNWSAWNPDNAGGIENCVQIYQPGDVQPGKWNDFPDSSTRSNPLCGVVEVPGKSNENSLSDQEKSLIGLWYQGGSAKQPCYITGTDNMLFAINHGRAARLLWTQDNGLFLSVWNASGEIIKDRILWSNGTWWSRKSSNYGYGQTVSAADEVPFHIVPD